MSELTRIGLLGRRVTVLLRYPRDGDPTFDVYVGESTGSNGARAVRLSYVSQWGEPTSQCIGLETTRPNFGGSRDWFACPDCGRRAVTLFCPPTETHFACRPCLKLAYRCQGENDFDRALRRANKIESRLGGPDAVHKSPPARPKGMWFRTYVRHLQARQACLGAMAGQLERWSGGKRERASNGNRGSTLRGCTSSNRVSK